MTETVPVVGLTGGIASGKSTVARFFEEHGVPVVDADQLAREVVAPGTDALREIVAAFGPGVLAPDGSLDRKALGAVVFADPAARRRLEAITHPRIGAASAARIRELASSRPPYVLYEAALLVENGLHRGLAALVVVAANEATQMARLRERDGLSEQDARARVAAQAPLRRKLDAADFVIWTDTTLGETRQRVGETHAALVARLTSASEER